MKNNFRIFLPIWVFILSLAACSKLTLTNDYSVDQPTSIVGTWNMVHIREIKADLKTNVILSDTAEDLPTDPINTYVIIQFNKSGDWHYKTDFDFDTMTGDTTDVDTQKGTYMVTKDSIIMTENGETNSVAYSLSNNLLTMTGVQKGMDDEGNKVKLTTIFTYKKIE